MESASAGFGVESSYKCDGGGGLGGNCSAYLTVDSACSTAVGRRKMNDARHRAIEVGHIEGWAELLCAAAGLLTEIQ